MSAWCECCLLSGRGLCVRPITRPEESYRVYYVWMWSWSLDNEDPGPLGVVDSGWKKIYFIGLHINCMKESGGMRHARFIYWCTMQFLTALCKPQQIESSKQEKDGTTNVKYERIWNEADTVYTRMLSSVLWFHTLNLVRISRFLQVHSSYVWSNRSNTIERSVQFIRGLEL
jgi:hypothetical protein